MCIHRPWFQAPAPNHLLRAVAVRLWSVSGRLTPARPRPALRLSAKSKFGPAKPAHEKRAGMKASHRARPNSRKSWPQKSNRWWRQFGNSPASATTYFQRVEAEAVALAVAIARKILHREAQVDPLLLAGVVRVGLDNVAAGTRVRLRVHPQQVQAWKEFLLPTERFANASGTDGGPHAGPGQLRPGNGLGLHGPDARIPAQGNRAGLL